MCVFREARSCAPGRLVVTFVAAVYAIVATVSTGEKGPDLKIHHQDLVDRCDKITILTFILIYIYTTGIRERQVMNTPYVLYVVRMIWNILVLGWFDIIYCRIRFLRNTWARRDGPTLTSTHPYSSTYGSTGLSCCCACINTVVHGTVYSRLRCLL